VTYFKFKQGPKFWLSTLTSNHTLYLHIGMGLTTAYYYQSFYSKYYIDEVW